MAHAARRPYPSLHGLATLLVCSAMASGCGTPFGPLFIAGLLAADGQSQKPGDGPSWTCPPATNSPAVPAASANAEATLGTERAEMPAVGDAWVYAVIDRQYGQHPIDVTVRAVRVDRSVIEETVISSARNDQETRRAVSVGEQQFLTRRLTDGVALTEFAPYFLSANGEGASAVVTTAAGYPIGPGNPEWITKSELPNWEHVTVPAGTFRALRLETCGRRARSPFSPIVTVSFLVRVWYAPEVKRYVRLEQKEWKGGSQTLNTHIVIELKKFEPRS